MLSANIIGTFRGGRPFAGGVLILLSAAFLALPAVASIRLGDVLVTVTTVAGVSTVLLAAMMGVCGVSVLTTAAARVPAGVATLVIAVIALPAANFGGFLLGTVTGIVGSAFTLGWSNRA